MTPCRTAQAKNKLTESLLLKLTGTRLFNDKFTAKDNI